MNLENLDQFCSTENYYTNPFYPFLYTDGVKYVAENGKAYWLLDAIASWQGEPIIKSNQDLSQIQFWKLKVNPDQSAILICERDTDEPVITQKIPLTDFPIPGITLYLCDMRTGKGVLILPSEY
ncbi:DUF6876 family protein [Microcystis sp. M169S2]|uniref:DUF6876 family protein n=1 Tax=Microcystis sp. M169S2 TaxID=2771157 RepID=UPI00258D4CC1|nr:DUF6876 family protein [Microcystis sp. M169S2]MCA2720194.1 hypothetical protein [Microcystis sp. M169S2]